jgi:hypothetical protein
MDLWTRIGLGIVISPGLGLVAFFAWNLLWRLVDYYSAGLAAILRSVATIYGAWPDGAARAGRLGRAAMFVAAALFWLTVLAGALTYPQVRWLSEGTASLTLVVVVYLWIPAGFLQHMFGGRR